MKLASHRRGVGGQKVLSHLAAVWRPRGQSSHLSSLIKGHRDLHDCTQPSPLSAAARDTEGGNVAAVVENGTWWYLYPRVTPFFSF